MAAATHTVVGLFDEYSDAETAIRALEAAGVPSTDISVIANNRADRYGSYPQYGLGRSGHAEGSGTGTGAGIGAVLGAAAGLLAGIGALAIPGVGPVVAAGPLAATLAGAGVGAVVGGLVGSLVEAGIPREHADIYAEAIRRGGTLVTVRTEDGHRERVSDILNRHSPVDVEERAAAWRQSGWTGFEEQASPHAGPLSGGMPPVGSAAAADDRIPETGTLPNAAELRRDWEVKRDADRLANDTERRRAVRIYSPMGEGEQVGEKR
jgi:hypothetical protein